MGQNNRDEWTNDAVDKEIFQFHDILTDSKSGLDVLLPMCGRSKLILTFAEKGHNVVGIEWSELAIRKFLEENNLDYDKKLYKIGSEKEMTVFTVKGKKITLYCGDIFAFKEDNLGGFDCVFDHASIGSFDFTKVKRSTYAELIASFTRPRGRVLLSIFDYDHSEHPTLPFAVTEYEVKSLYKEHFEPPQLLHEVDATKMEELCKMDHTYTLFPVWNFSYFSWKILLLVKH